MARLVPTRRYVRHVKAQLAYIADRSPSGAARVERRIRESLETLILFPLGGRPGRIEGTRELVVTRTPYVICYRVVGDEIQLLFMQHGRQQWPEQE